MRSDEIPSLYDDAYVAAYDDRFLLRKPYDIVPAFEVQVIDRLLRADGSWLDVGCGTGYFLSQFPEADRAGLDLSPAMLRAASAQNPSARFVREGDFREPRPEWDGAWDLVSCMWCAYSYVETMDEVDRVLDNLAAWTSDRGVLFLPLCDLEDVIPGRGTLPYKTQDVDFFGGPVTIDAVIWSYVDTAHGKDHRYLLSPHVEHLRARLRTHFDRVDVVDYPPYGHPVPGQRKALVAAGKGGAPVSADLAATLDAFQREGEAYRARVLTMDDLSRPPSPGWLRRAWRALPAPLRRAARRVIGER